MPKRPSCPVCDSRKWRKDSSSGQVVCSEGHVLQSYVEEGRDDEFAASQGAMRRQVKSQRVKHGKRIRADDRKLYGNRAKFFFFQVQQVVLRLQIQALVKLWKLPSEEFEVLCRDLWSLHLSLLPDPPPPEALNPTQPTEEDDTVANAAQSKQDSGSSSSSGAEHQNSGNDSSSDSENSVTSLPDEPAPKPVLDPDPRLAKLLREVSGSETSRSRSRSVSTTGGASSSFNRCVTRRAYAGPLGNISILVIACWTLRVPVTYMDFIKLIELYDLPYLETLRLLSPTLSEPLTGAFKTALEPRHAPTTTALHEVTSRLAKLLHVDFGVSTPEMNAAPIFWRAVHVFKGSSVLYSMTKALAAVLALPLTLHRVLAPTLGTNHYGTGKVQKGDAAPPELSIIATVVLALKLVYGLDGKSRRPRTVDDPASSFPERDEYFAMLREELRASREAPQSVFSADSQISATDMSGPEIDSYLDFCEKALLRADGALDSASDFQSVSQYFPLVRQKPSSPPKKAPEPSLVVQKLEAMALHEDERGGDDANPPLLPGQEHPVYDSSDILGYLPPDYELVLEVAGNWVGVGKESVAVLVERFENRLGRWADQQRREKRKEAKKNKAATATSATRS